MANLFSENEQNMIFRVKDGISTALPVENVQKVGDYTVNITLPMDLDDSTVDQFLIKPIVNIDSGYKGSINIIIESFGAGVRSGQYTIALAHEPEGVHDLFNVITASKLNSELDLDVSIAKYGNKRPANFLREMSDYSIYVNNKQVDLALPVYRSEAEFNTSSKFYFPVSKLIEIFNLRGSFNESTSLLMLEWNSSDGVKNLFVNVENNPDDKYIPTGSGNGGITTYNCYLIDGILYLNIKLVTDTLSGGFMYDPVRHNLNISTNGPIIVQ